MKLGLGLYRWQLTPADLRFARQAGATHIVAHYTDYRRTLSHQGMAGAIGDASRDPPVPVGERWTREELVALRRMIEDHGLKLAAIENFEPHFWSDVLLGGPRRDAQMENLKSIIRDMGAAGIPVMGYNFSITGVYGRSIRPVARGNALAPSFRLAELKDVPMPRGVVWDTRIWEDDGLLDPPTAEAFWERLRLFLEELVPVAEEAGVKLAGHPPDPPVATLRGVPQLMVRPEDLQRLLDLVPSSANQLEFCQGTVSEMGGAEGVYQAIASFAAQGKIAYVHFRNVRGQVPDYDETFVDEGDVNMLRALVLYADNGFDGVVMPDHAPAMECAAPWHAGMAHALGWMSAAMQALGVLER